MHLVVLSTLVNQIQMKKLLLLLAFVPSIIMAQNRGLVNPVAFQVLTGAYNPANYAQQTPITGHVQILSGIQNQISPDSLKVYLERLDDFETRNTGSDTTALNYGIGAARNWILSKFNQFSMRNENRLLASHFYFTLPICGMTKHKNVVGVLPGSDTAQKDIIIIEGHYDSRCESNCDTACVAHGMEDNGSGTALVLELARVMSQYTFPQTIVFMATTAEEQGLWGAYEFAGFIDDHGIGVEAVLNNDVIGGIICGQTSSPPGCPGPNHIDSTQVRIFSYGGFNSLHKMLARFIKLEYEEEVLPNASVPMQISLMSAEDRTGRGGDHIPFRKKNIAAVRFTSANEHGDAGVGSGYTDRQHTSDDILGVDTDGDNVIDSFYVDFNYLARNAVINANAAAVLALGPQQPTFTASPQADGSVVIDVQDPNAYGTYRLGIRTTALDFDTLITFTGTTHTIYPALGSDVLLSLCAQDANGLESLFDTEFGLYGLAVNSPAARVPAELALMPNYPNPFDDATIIGFKAPESARDKQAVIKITSVEGVELAQLPVAILPGLNEVAYHHGYGMSGTYLYSLWVEGELIDTKRMVFAN